MKIKLFAILLSIMLVLNTIPANATALVPAVTGEAVAALAGTAVEANIIASLLSNGFNLDFSNYSGTSDEFFQSLTFQNFTADMITSDILGLQEKYGHDYDEILDLLLKRLGGSVESEVVPYKPWSRYQLERVVVNLSIEDLPDPEPTYPVSDEERTLASMILNRDLYIQTYGNNFYEQYSSYNPDNYAPYDSLKYCIYGGTSNALGSYDFMFYGSNTKPIVLLYKPNGSVVHYVYTDEGWFPFDYCSCVFRGNYSSYGLSNVYFRSRTSTTSNLPKTYAAYQLSRTTLDNISYEYFSQNSFNGGCYVPHASYNSLLAFLTRYVGYCNNIQVYVGNDPSDWMPIIPNTPLPSIIGFGQGATIETPSIDKPIVGVYPPQTFINIRPFIDLIIAAINNKSVLTFDDIKPLIVDVNGQQAITTVQIVRNDYDTLFVEQYPDLLPTVNFNDDNTSIRSLLPLVSAAPGIIEYVEVVPSSVLFPVVGCGIILLFCIVIRRMLD